MASHTTKEGRRKRRRAESERYTSNEYRPYVTAIGQVALAWNDLHETICQFFNEIASIVGESKIEAAFQAVDSDRVKRRMLKAVFAQLDIHEERKNPYAVEDVKWVCNQIDALEEGRNNAIHSPLHHFHSAPKFNLPVGVQPNYLFGNTRAAKLRDKHLLTEYRYVRDAAIILRDFVEDMQDAWRWTDDSDGPWPERPQLPYRGQKSHKKGSKAPRPDARKQLPLLPESSQE